MTSLYGSNWTGDLVALLKLLTTILVVSESDTASDSESADNYSSTLTDGDVDIDAIEPYQDEPPASDHDDDTEVESDPDFTDPDCIPRNVLDNVLKG